MIPSIAKLPRIPLGSYPTPLVEAPNLSAALSGPRILIKRDDLTGLALGGNKCRKLEFVMADAKQKGFDALVTTGGSQSNFALQLATAARRLNMDFYLVLVKGVHIEKQGNLLLDDIIDSKIKLVEADDIEDIFGPTMMAKMNEAADELKKKGRNPLVVPAGAFNPVGTVGWVDAVDEIWQQLQAQKINAQYLVVTCGSSGTQAGLTLGVKYLKLPLEIVGFTIASPKEKSTNSIVNMANETAKLLGMDVTVTPDDVMVNDDYIGEGYGIVTEAGLQAIRLVAQTEGIFLDPVYTGKAMAGFIDFIKKGYFKSTDTAVFIHTGGVPALFAYDKEIAG
ncbi:D-cysteine desulfhydrase family protein [Chloroflexota bacterium]